MTIQDVARLRVEVLHLQSAIDNPDAATPDFITSAEGRSQWRAAWLESNIKAAINGIEHAIKCSDENPD